MQHVNYMLTLTFFSVKGITFMNWKVKKLLLLVSLDKDTNNDVMCSPRPCKGLVALMDH